MRRLSRRSVSQDEDRTPSDGITEVSPTRSLASTTSRGSKMGHSRRSSGVEDSTPTRPPTAGSPPKSGNNKKVLKIGANVRFRGDVMECDTVLLCGRLQGCVESRRIIVREGGVFVGDAKVEDADVHGTLEGTLKTTSNLAIRSTGAVCGTVVYRRMMMEDGGELEGTFECSSRRTPRDAPSPLQRLRELEQRQQQEKDQKAKDQRQAIQAQLESEEADDNEEGGEQENQMMVEPRPQQASGMASDEAGDGDSMVPGVALEESVVIAVPFVGTDVELMPVEVSVIATEEEEEEEEEEEFRAPAPVPMTIDGGEDTMARQEQSARRARAEAASTANVQAAGVTAAETPPWWSTCKAKPNSESPSSSRSLVSDATASAKATPGKSSFPKTPSSRLPTSAPRTEGVVSANRRIFAGNASTTPPYRVPGVSPTNRSRSPGVSPAKTQEAGNTKDPGSQTSEASVSFSDSDTPRNLASNPFVAQDSTRLFRRNGSPPARETPPSSGVRGPPLVLDRSSSVAAMVETWPPVSPRQAKPPVTWPKLTQNTARGVTPPSAATAPPATPASATDEILSPCETAQPPPPGGESTATPQGAGNGGVEIGGGSGGGGEGVVEAGNAGGWPGEESSPQEQVVKLTKACEFKGCTLEACWGDPRFRPRYCARHKRPGNKLMDPVPVEEGDTAAEPDGGVAPSERASPPRSMRLKNGNAKPAGFAARPLRHLVSPGESSSEPFASARGFVIGQPQASEVSNDGDDEEIGDSGVDGVQEAGNDENAGDEEDYDNEEDDDDGTEFVGDSEEDDEEEDEGWDDGGEGAAGVVVVGTVNGNGVARTRVPRGGSRPGSVGRARKLFASTTSASFSRLSNQVRLQQQQGKNLRRRDSDVERAFGGDIGEGLDFDDEGDVLARVAKFERLAKKSSPTLKPKTPSKLPLKSSSGNNIADFYGRGRESESEEEEVTYSLDSFNKDLLLAQEAEAGTHTEDGQLRPQASEQRDQQRMAHLVKVGKLGSVFGGRGVAAAGKRR